MADDWRSLAEAEEQENRVVAAAEAAEAAEREAELGGLAAAEAADASALAAVAAEEAAQLAEEQAFLEAGEIEEGRAIAAADVQAAAQMAQQMAALEVEEAEEKATRSQQIAAMAAAEAEDARALAELEESTKPDMGALPVPPNGWKMKRLASSTADGLRHFNTLMPRTAADIRAVRRAAMLNGCGCGKRRCEQCTCLGAEWISQVLLWYVTIGGHNDALSMHAQLDQIEHTSEVLRAIRRICWVRAHWQTVGGIEFRSNQAQARADIVIQRSLSLVIDKIKSNLPALNVCHAATLLLATCTFRWFQFPLLLGSGSLFDLLVWIAGQLFDENLSQQWLNPFLKGRYQILLQITREMLGELFSVLPGQMLHDNQYGRVVDVVFGMIIRMAHNVFVRFTQWNLLRDPDDAKKYIDQAARIKDEVILIVRLLRLHRDMNTWLPNVTIPWHWPCEHVNVFFMNLISMETSIPQSPLGQLKQVATDMVEFSIDLFVLFPRLPESDRTYTHQWVAIEVKARLARMAPHGSVDSAICAVASLMMPAFNQALAAYYFRTAPDE